MARYATLIKTSGTPNQILHLAEAPGPGDALAMALEADDRGDLMAHGRTIIDDPRYTVVNLLVEHNALVVELDADRDELRAAVEANDASIARDLLNTMFEQLGGIR